jgi:hypothetical protein
MRGGAGSADHVDILGNEELLRDVLALAAVSFRPPRTKWTRRVPHPVLSGHAASLTPY